MSTLTKFNFKRINILIPTYHRLMLLVILSLLLGLSKADFMITPFEVRNIKDPNFTSEKNNQDLSPYTTQCNGKNLAGGYLSTRSPGAYLSDDFTILMPHQMIFLSFAIYIIDNWDTASFINFDLYDELNIQHRQVFYVSSVQKAISQNLCGSSTSKDLNVTLMYAIPHISNSFAYTIKLLPSSTSNRPYFGIRDVNLIISNKTATVQNRFTFQENLYCDNGQYPDASSCFSCHSTCINCYGPGPDQCFSCQSSFRYNGTHCSTCSSSCQTCSGPGSNQCLSCDSGKYLYPSSKCETACASPYKSRVTNGISYCDFPCSGSEYYYNVTNSCMSVCQTPNISRTDSYGSQYCNPICNGNDFLYPNGTCLPTCNNPFESLTPKICTPKPINTTPNIPNPSTTANTFNTPYPEVQVAQRASAAYSFGESMNNFGILIFSAISPTDPGSVLAGVISKMLIYVKYMKIDYPTEVRTLFKGTNHTSRPLGFGPRMTGSIRSRFVQKTLPVNFAEYHLSSSFIINFWNSLFSLGVFLGLLFVIKGFEIMAKKTKIKFLPYTVVRSIRASVQNFVIIQFYGVYGDIVLFSCLQFQRMTLGSFSSNMSLFISLFLLTSGVGLLYIHFCTLHKYQLLLKKDLNETQRDDELLIFRNNYTGLQIFFVCFRDYTFAVQGYLFFFTIRVTLFNLVIAFLYNYPLIQAILTTVLCLIVVIYIIAKRPCKELINLIQQGSCEVILLCCNACLIAMAIVDRAGQDLHNIKHGTGYVIIVSSYILIYLPTTFMALKIIIAVWSFYKSMKARQNLKRPGLSIENYHPRTNLRVNNPIIEIKDDMSIDQSVVQNLNNLSQTRKEVTKNEHPLYELNSSSYIVHGNLSRRSKPQTVDPPIQLTGDKLQPNDNRIQDFTIFNSSFHEPIQVNKSSKQANTVTSYIENVECLKNEANFVPSRKISATELESLGYINEQDQQNIIWSSNSIAVDLNYASNRGTKSKVWKKKLERKDYR